MICKECGSEKFDVINVFRNRSRKYEKWIFDSDCDTRLIICENCGSRYFTETKISSEIVYNKNNFKRYEKKC